MLIAQVTDVHLGFDRERGEDANARRFQEVLAELRAIGPDLLLLTGDLVEHGDDRASYDHLAGLVADLPFPVHAAIGNHDERGNFRAAFGRAGEGFLHYAVDDGPVRILVLDTAEEGRHGGAFCPARAGWLAKRLDEQPQRPTLLALHHPPIASGLSWMTENPDAGWVQRLAAVVAPRRNVVAMVCGHLHRPILTLFAGVPLIVCPSSAPQVALDLRTIDPEQPDGRAMLVAEAPGFALHLWDGGRLTSHFGTPQPPVVARFTEGFQPLLRMLRDEREQRA